MDFKKHFSLEDYKTLVDSTIKDDKKREEELEMIKTHFNTPLKNYLIELRDAGKLSKVANSEGHRTNFSHLWNLFLEDKEHQYGWNVFDFLDKHMFLHMYDQKMNIEKKKVELNEETYLKGYENFSNDLNQGSFSNYDLPEDSCVCHECSQRLLLSFDNWQGKFEVFAKKLDGDTDYKNRTKPENCLPNEIVEVKVNFPSGKLIVADWVRIPEFTEIVEGEDRWSEERSLNHTKGRIKTAQRYAELFNFVSVPLGNCSPDVYLQNGNLIIGKPNYDEDTGDYVEVGSDYKKVASVCTDLWATTIIDIAQLVEILREKHGDKSEKLVDEYMKNNDTYYQTVNVEPGEYLLRFHGNYGSFNDLIQKEEESPPPTLDSFFMVNKLPKLTNKLKIS